MQSEIWSRTSFRQRPEVVWCLQRGNFSQATPAQDTGVADAQHPERDDALYCVECHAPITRRRYRIVINEQHEHVFANPAGHVFQIGCFSAAAGCIIAGEESEYFTWFPGYAWRYALCGQCIALLGWAFRSQDSGFLGLIVEKLREA